MPVPPVLGPALDFLLPIAVSFLHEADKFVVVSFDLEQVVVSKLALFVLDLAFKLTPAPFELVLVHKRTSLCLALYLSSSHASLLAPPIIVSNCLGRN